MLNSEYYKSHHDRVQAYLLTKIGFKENNLVEYLEDFSSWLDKVATVPKPLECPFCGKETGTWHDSRGAYVECRECHYRSKSTPSLHEAIEQHNLLVAKIKENKKKYL